MTDRELLELAAKAAGVEQIERVQVDEEDENPKYLYVRLEHGLTYTTFWDPLGDDGDALRLAVKLGLVVEIGYASRGFVVVRTNTDNWVEYREAWGDCPYAATRRAIVRAAAGLSK